jgi:hypothetical protein
LDLGKAKGRERKGFGVWEKRKFERNILT